MRRLALGAVLLFVVPAAFAVQPHEDLRASYPSVHQALSRMPDHGMGGTLNRISSLVEQRRIAGLPTGSSASLPAGFERRMTSALEQLERDLDRGLPSLQIGDRLIIAQVVNEVAFDRNLDLYSDILVPCNGALPCANPESIQVLDRIADALAASIRQGLIDWEQRTGLRAPLARASAASDPSAQSFRSWLQAVVVNSLYIPGVESIDGRS